ncbi:MAG TPA: glycosyl hydrolase family 28-related protein, partial [Pseudogracilibacillus sp.]|nr:glycosyl hydrolase family 28-related protein [Pseudogracilibacillus sp.]
MRNKYDKKKLTDINDVVRFLKQSPQNPYYDFDTDYTTNSPNYYDYLAKLKPLIQILAERIYDYDEILDLKLEEIEEVLEQVINKIGEGFNEEIEQLLREWVLDGTLDFIINETLMNLKADITYVDEEIDKVSLLTNSLIVELENRMNERIDLIERLGDISYNVLSYGAKGDGVTDDYESIQNAINEQKNIYLPEGTYLVSKGLRIPSNRKIYGAGIDKTIIKYHDIAP